MIKDKRLRQHDKLCIYIYIVTRLSDRRRGIGLTTGFIGLLCTITVTAYHNVHPLQ
jgi:hypothetical protein